MHKLPVFILFAAFLAVTVLSGPTAKAAQSPEVCLKTCIETYGTDKKQACALQCGFGQQRTGGQQNRDCGTVYKNCLKSCGADSGCKSTCRKQRTQCF